MKRPRGTGNLYLKHGAYYGRWRRPNGQRVNRRVGKARARGETDGLTRAQAERELRRLIEADEGRPALPTFTRPPTVDEAATALRNRLDVEGVRPSDRRNLESMQRVHISPAFGDRPIATIQREDIERLRRRMLAQGLAPKTVRNVMSFLSSVCTLAVENGWAPANPVSRAARPKRRRHRDADPDIQFLTLDELHAVLAAIPDDVVRPTPAPTRRGRRGSAPPPSKDVLGPVMRVLIFVAASSGLRQSELLGLRWNDLDWRARRLRVRNPLVQGEFSSEGKSDLST